MEEKPLSLNPIRRGSDWWTDRNHEVGPYFQDMIKTRLTKRYNVIMLYCGMAGIGKSFAGMATCEEFDKSFDVDRIVFSGEEILRVVQTMKSLQWILVDEAGINMGKRSWYEEVQRAIVDTVETFRFLRLGLIFCTLNRNLLDSIVRSYLIHYQVNMIDRGYGKLYEIQPSMFDAEIRTPFIQDLYFEKPSAKLIADYEEKRKITQKARYSRSLGEIEQKNSSNKTFKELVQEAIANIDAMKDAKGSVTTGQLMLNLGIGKGRADHIRASLKTLGY
ncbi:hypothetical protein MUP77_10000 [Candidatus Bathyarchaeota archaeon]|nr:hypothetical protein [Candidatus Bathyarchaeota archaeon]